MDRRYLIPVIFLSLVLISFAIPLSSAIGGCLPTQVTFKSFTANLSAVSGGQSILFTNSTGCTGTGGLTYSYSVQSPAGAQAPSISGNVITFYTPGSYTITLNATDSSGDMASIQTTITVTPPLEITSFTANLPTVISSNSVLFTNTTSGGTGSNLYSYMVQSPLGAQTPSILNNVVTFYAPGTYTVTLEVTDITGETNSSSTTVAVTSPPPPPGCKSNKGGIIYVVGSSKHQTIQITDQSGVVIVGSSNNVTINMPGSNCAILVSVTGSSNKVKVYNGSASLSVVGSSNLVALQNTVLTSECITGSSDSVSGAIIDSNTFTVTGSSNDAQTLRILHLNSIYITGSSSDIVLNSATTSPFNVTITGSSNVAHINNATIVLRITGSSDSVYATNTVIAKQTIVGSSNHVYII